VRDRSRRKREQAKNMTRSTVNPATTCGAGAVSNRFSRHPRTIAPGAARPELASPISPEPARRSRCSCNRAALRALPDARSRIAARSFRKR
jgi:hypothetical protein